MIRKPWHCIHWAMHAEERPPEFLITPRIMLCQNLCTNLAFWTIFYHTNVQILDYYFRIFNHTTDIENARLIRIKKKLQFCWSVHLYSANTRVFIQSKKHRKFRSKVWVVLVNLSYSSNFKPEILADPEARKDYKSYFSIAQSNATKICPKLWVTKH